MGHHRFCVGLLEYPRKCMLILNNAAMNAGHVKFFQNYCSILYCEMIIHSMILCFFILLQANVQPDDSYNAGWNSYREIVRSSSNFHKTWTILISFSHQIFFTFISSTVMHTDVRVVSIKGTTTEDCLHMDSSRCQKLSKIL